MFAWSSFDTKVVCTLIKTSSWCQLWLGWKVYWKHQFFVKQRSCKHCFKNEWILVEGWNFNLISFPVDRCKKLSYWKRHDLKKYSNYLILLTLGAVHKVRHHFRGEMGWQIEDTWGREGSREVTSLFSTFLETGKLTFHGFYEVE